MCINSEVIIHHDILGEKITQTLVFLLPQPVKRGRNERKGHEVMLCLLAFWLDFFLFYIKENLNMTKGHGAGESRACLVMNKIRRISLHSFYCLHPSHLFPSLPLLSSLPVFYKEEGTTKER